jgi:hypothetical protein
MTAARGRFAPRGARSTFSGAINVPLKVLYRKSTARLDCVTPLIVYWESLHDEGRPVAKLPRCPLSPLIGEHIRRLLGHFEPDYWPRSTRCRPFQTYLWLLDRGERRERTPPARKRMARYERHYCLLRCPIRLRNLSTARSYAPLRRGLTSSKVSWVGFRIAIQHIHP